MLQDCVNKINLKNERKYFGFFIAYLESFAYVELVNEDGFFDGLLLVRENFIESSQNNSFTEELTSKSDFNKKLKIYNKKRLKGPLFSENILSKALEQSLGQGVYIFTEDTEGLFRLKNFKDNLLQIEDEEKAIKKIKIDQIIYLVFAL